MIKVDLSGAAGFFDPAGPDYAAAAQAHRTLLEHTGAGADFTGWLDLPERMQSGELKQILAAASRIRGRSQALVVVGIGGSYLGAKGMILQKLSLSMTICWNIHSTPDRKFMREDLCRKFFFPAIIKILKAGAENSLSAAPWKDGRIF